MRIQILLPCLLVLALCGGLLAQKNIFHREGTVAPKAAPTLAKSTGQPPLRLPEKKLPPVRAEALEFAAPLPARTADDELTTAAEITAALGDRDAEVRTAAREAAVQSGDRSLIPALQMAASQTDDAREKTALLDAADFLQLPSLSEALAGQ